MSTKVRTTIIGAMAASLLAVTAIPAAAIVPVTHGGHGHGHGGIAAAAASVPVKHGGHGGNGGCAVTPPRVCP
jgi:hypothetical protein